MRIVIHGQQAFGKAVLDALLERGEEVVGVFCAPDKAGRPLDPIKEFALEKGLPVYQLASSVAHFFLNLELRHLDVLPRVGVVGLSSGLKNPLQRLEPCRAVCVSEASCPDLTGLDAAELAGGIEALTNVTNHPAAWGREE